MPVNASTIKITDYRGDRSKLRATHPAEKHPRHYRGTCPDHGAHETLDLDDFSVEKNGIEWVPKDPDNTVISYCEECIEVERDFSQRDTEDPGVVADLIPTTRHWREFKKNIFETRDLAEGRELTYCPYCGGELETVNQETGQATCSEHGPLTLDVEQLRKQEV